MGIEVAAALRGACSPQGDGHHNAMPSHTEFLTLPKSGSLADDRRKTSADILQRLEADRPWSQCLRMRRGASQDINDPSGDTVGEFEQVLDEGVDVLLLPKLAVPVLRRSR
jgi:hypothetical protein